MDTSSSGSISFKRQNILKRMWCKIINVFIRRQKTTLHSSEKEFEKYMKGK
jgi:hypothetical protein